MKLYCLKYEQILPVPLEEAWTFFSNPANLAEITPDALDFTMTSELPEQVYSGLIVSYTIKPVAFIKLNWVTEIMHVEKNHFFVDEQRFGPYKFWHHKHIFEPVANGTRMYDIVHYMLPFGWLGRLAHWALVEDQLRDIFRHRKRVLSEMFARST